VERRGGRGRPRQGRGRGEEGGDRRRGACGGPRAGHGDSGERAPRGPMARGRSQEEGVPGPYLTVRRRKIMVKKATPGSCGCWSASALGDRHDQEIRPGRPGSTRATLPVRARPRGGARGALRRMAEVARVPCGGGPCAASTPRAPAGRPRRVLRAARVAEPTISDVMAPRRHPLPVEQWTERPRRKRGPQADRLAAWRRPA